MVWLGKGAFGRSSKSTTSPALLLLLLLLAQPATADCECGYSSPVGRSNSAASPQRQQQYVFTDLFESHFARGHHVDIAANTDWVRQAFNLTQDRARGDYGEMFAVENVVATGGGEDDAGLKLVVGSRLVNNMVPVAEIDTHRLDMLWGTFRASMKMTDVPGTCAAFFWYFNDTQEIDMEFLSKDFNPSNNSYPVNLVIQSREAMLKGYDAALTGNFVKAYLPFNPTTDFHEYRIDYVPGRVVFYADGVVLAVMDGASVPTSSGHLILQHWSNGNKLWSGGPPREDAVLMVKYVKAYFNSSTEERAQDWSRRCGDPRASNALCMIPELTKASPGAADWFFSEQGNMTNGQTVFGLNSASRRRGPWCRETIGVLLLVTGWVSAML